MPSLRSISLNLGVSVPSVSKAFQILEREGLLSSCGERCRWLVRALPKNPRRKRGMKPEASAGRAKRLLYLTSQPVNEWLAHSVEVYADMVSEMSSKDWEVIHRVMPFQNAKAPRKIWDELLDQEAPDVIVVLIGNPVLAAWAVGHSVPTLFLGGVCEPYSLPMVSVSLSGLVKELVQKLIDLGHRHIVMPLCGRNSGFQESMKLALQAGIDSRRSSGVLVHPLESPYSTPEVFYDVLKKHWRHHRPDAMILLDWREFITASSFFRDGRILIPKDISVALLSADNSMDWYLPKLSHYEFSNMKLAKAVARWAVNVDKDSPSTAKVRMGAHWHEGASILDRR
jgi:DNA-binding LacI/PurR family transcriptional regulator